ncbi:MAG: hypothetical protein ACLQGP_40650 [Isosphaeraceae bacterium]
MVRGLVGKADGQGFWAWLTMPRRYAVTAETLTWLAVAVGVILRLMDYAEFRVLYRDEASLLENLEALAVFDFRTILTEYQLAPPGFLVLERLMVRLPWNNVLEARFFPMVCGIASMFLFRATARRYLTPRAVPIATGLFALGDWLIYYSSEIKQYSCDLMLTLIALRLAAGAESASDSPPDSSPGPAPLTTRRLLAIAGFGVVGVWFSYPLALVLAGVGTYLIVVAAFRKAWGSFLGLAATGLAWLSSFAACYVVSHRILSKERFIWDWWDFAFLPIPPRSLADLDKDFWQILNAFDSPASLLTPLGVVLSAFLAMGLFLLGGVALARRWPGGLYLLVAPIFFTLTASALHQYPFHGRLLIFLVPSIHMLVGEGAVALTRRGGRWLILAIAAFLLFQPASDILWQLFVPTAKHVGYDSHGDLRPDLLDYLDLQRARRRPQP